MAMLNDQMVTIPKWPIFQMSYSNWSSWVGIGCIYYVVFVHAHFEESLVSDG